MKISRLGEAPDYRFSLANERTFLAWIRTALGFLAAGVGLDQLAPDFATPVIRELLALLLCLFAGGLAIYGYLRWLRNEKAMRLKEDLPYTHSLLIISLMLMIVCGDCHGAGVVCRIAAKPAVRLIPVYSRSARRWPGFVPC
ncbi:Inner membrane protein yidH [Citrobacter koseri]|uniref:Inner membrane protein yidH n=1 Tax=Citrobacter koseri TaxID=545 RepID=A0A447UN13_CITKO|nr:Inner membrane protein yidH [Citrobacter koseri]